MTATAVPLTLSRAEAAARMGVSESWLANHRDEVPYVKVGRQRRYTVEDLTAYLDSQRVNPLARSPRSKAGRR